MRTLYIVSRGTRITEDVVAAAAAAGATEIVRGAPPAISVRNPVYPFVYVEPDDPGAESRRNDIKTLEDYEGIANPTAVQTVRAIRAMIRLRGS